MLLQLTPQLLVFLVFLLDEFLLLCEIFSSFHILLAAVVRDFLCRLVLLIAVLDIREELQFHDFIKDDRLPEFSFADLVRSRPKQRIDLFLFDLNFHCFLP